MRALQKDPIERPTANELRNHPWIQTLKRGAPPALSQLRAASNEAAASKQVIKQQPQQLAPKASGESISSTSSGSDGVGLSSPKGPMPMERLSSKELRTDDGDLLKSYGSPSYLSFTAGSNAVKLLSSKDKAKTAAAASSGSFTTANNPKLQQSRG